MGGITYKKHNFSGFLPYIFFLTSLEIVNLIIEINASTHALEETSAEYKSGAL